MVRFYSFSSVFIYILGEYQGQVIIKGYAMYCKNRRVVRHHSGANAWIKLT